MSSLYQVNAGDRILAVDNIQFYNLLKGVAASGENILLIYNAGALTFQPSSDPSAGTRVLTIKNNAGTTLFAARYDGLLEMLAAAAAPGTPVAGSVYWDTLLAALRVYDGTNWQEPGIRVNQWNWYWEPGMSIESTLVGTGAYTVNTISTSGILATGATSASSSGLRRSPNLVAAVAGPHGAFDVRYWSFTWLPFQIDAATDCRIFITDESAATQPSLTAKHMGIRQTTAQTFLFSTADGATEQTTDITSFIASQTETHTVITFDGTTARCYIGGTLRATHATNVPTSTATTGATFRAFVLNSAAADKKFYVGPQRMQGVA